MTRSYPLLLFTLAAVWGASYLFIKVAVDEIEPAALMAARLLIAAALLLPFLVARTGASAAFSDLRAAWRPGLVLGVLNAAVPFTLVAWGEQYVDSGVAAIANATVPIFVTLLAIRYKPSERATGLRVVGIGVGLAGVAVLAGGQPDVGGWTVAGVLAVVVAALSFCRRRACTASSASRTRRARCSRPRRWPPARSSCSRSGSRRCPTTCRAGKRSGRCSRSRSLGTAFAQLILFRMLRLHGASKVSLVTYLLPVMAVFYGALLLDEPITAGILGGLVLVLVGVALGSGAVRLTRRVAEPVVPRP